MTISNPDLALRAGDTEFPGGADPVNTAPWFDNIAACDDPWFVWFLQLLFPEADEDDIETYVRLAIKVADARRRAVVPGTARFSAQWEEFHRQHCAFELSWQGRRARFLVWRLCALELVAKLRGPQRVLAYAKFHVATDQLKCCCDDVVALRPYGELVTSLMAASAAANWEI